LGYAGCFVGILSSSSETILAVAARFSLLFSIALVAS
jgi:hypothetical protein